jgi:arylsulfatase
VPAQTAPAKKPNILVIWGDDIRVHDISAYGHGIMGCETPGIDRRAKEGVSLDAAGIDHQTLGAAAAMKRPRQIESFSVPVCR